MSNSLLTSNQRTLSSDGELLTSGDEVLHVLMHSMTSTCSTPIDSVTYVYILGQPLHDEVLYLKGETCIGKYLKMAET